MHTFVNRYVQEAKKQAHRTSKDHSSWFLDQIIDGSRNDAEIRDQLLNVLLAGRDTTACCLSWTLYSYVTTSQSRIDKILILINLNHSLVRHPDILEPLRQIGSIILENCSPIRERLKKMPFLAVVTWQGAFLDTLSFMLAC